MGIPGGALKPQLEFEVSQTSGQKPSALDGQTLSMGRSWSGTCSCSTPSTRVCSKGRKGDRRCKRHHCRRRVLLIAMAVAVTVETVCSASSMPSVLLSAGSF
jgi:hypothetical protein